MLIIEGADNLGKTTAAKRLVKLADNHPSAGYWPVRYQHMSRPNKCFDFCNDYTDMMSKFAVQDRFHMGSLVWHEGVQTLARMKVIEGRLLALGSSMIVMYAGDDDWYRRHLAEQPKDELFDAETLVTANRKFREQSDYWSSMVDVMWDVCRFGFPDDIVLGAWLDRWVERLEVLR